MPSKPNSKAQRKVARLRRLMARLTILNEERPTDAFQLKIWAQQRAVIIRQLRKHGIEME